MNVTRYAITNNRATWITLLVLIIGGIISYVKMPRAEDPAFIIRVAVVKTFFPGASPARVERLITENLEKSIREMPELDFVHSESRTGVSVIYVNVKENFTNMQPIWDRLRRKVERTKPDLPEGIIGPIVDDEFGDVFGINIAITGDGFEYAEMEDIADEVRNELLLIDETAKVEIHGRQEERIFIEYRNSKLSEIGVSAAQLSQILQGRNILISGGSILYEGERISLEPSGNFESLDDLKKTIVSIPGRPELVYLEDLVKITRGYIDPPDIKVRATGEPALVLAVSLRKGGNILTLGEKVRDVLDRLQAIYPHGIEFETATFQPDVVKKKIDDFVMNLGQSVLVVALVMLLTLGFRTGLVVSSLVPVTIVISILIMAVCKIWLDQVSLAALIISLGMLVDNAIVIAESIMVRMREGQQRIEAAIDSVSELKISLLTSSLTTSAAFFPIYLAESMTGEYTVSIFKVVTITLLCSWVLSLTFVPLVCVLTIKIKNQKNHDIFDTVFYRIYRVFLGLLIRNRIKVLLLTVVIFVLVIGASKEVPQIFFPPSDRAFFLAEYELPPGTAIEKTEEVVNDFERFYKEELMQNKDSHRGITQWTSYIGRGGPRYVVNYNPKVLSPDYAVQFINVTSQKDIPYIMEKINKYAFDNYPELHLRLKKKDMGPPVNSPVEIRISGKNPAKLFDIAAAVKNKMKAVGSSRNIKDDWGSRTKKILVNVDQERARRAGLASQDIALSLMSGLSGWEMTKYREDDKIIPVVLRTLESDRKDLGKLEQLNVASQATGVSVPLSQVADLKMVWEYSKIKRRDGVKTITVSADPVEGYTALDVITGMQAWLNEQNDQWGYGYRYEIGGEVETTVKSSQSIVDKLPIAGLIIIILLIFQFNSVRKSLIVLATIPLGMIGVVIGLILLDSYFGFITLLGVVSLSGIVVNNAIVLIERIQMEIEENKRPVKEAIIEASQRRLRPILLTTATTIGGLLPLYFGGGVMWEPMAIAIIFGLLFSTVMTLGVVPTAYSLLFRKTNEH